MGNAGLPYLLAQSGDTDATSITIQAIVAGLALAALIVSIIVWRTQAKTAGEQTRIAREQSDIQERLTAIEEAPRAEEVEARARARVTASFLRADSQLVLHNEGPARARNVKAEVATLDGAEVAEVDGLDEVLPADMPPGQRMAFPVMLVLGMGASMRVTVRWTDEAGDHEEAFTLPTL